MCNKNLALPNNILLHRTNPQSTLVLTAGSASAAEDRTLNTSRIASKLLATNHFTRESADDDGKYVEKHDLDADVLYGL